MKYLNRLIIVLVNVMMLLIVTGCSSKKEPQIERIKELASIKTVYSNVAKTQIEPDKGIAHWGEKTKTYWLEYTGIATIGVNLEKKDDNFKIDVSGNKVKIYLPEVEILSVDIDTTKKYKEYESKDSLNKLEITLEKQNKIVDDAQEKMIQILSNSDDVLKYAEERIMSSIENYVKSVGNILGKTYTIEWKKSK